MIYTGVIKWYNPVRGFGFIALDDGKEMIYADNQKLVGIYRSAYWYEPRFASIWNRDR